MPACGLDPLCLTSTGLSQWLGTAIGDAIENLAAAVAESLGQVVASVGTLWVNVGTPNLTASAGGAPSDVVAFLRDSLWFYTAGLAVLAVLVGGARMAWERRGAPALDLLRSLLTLVVVSGAGLAAIGLAVAAADGFSTWILARSTPGTDFGTNITALVWLGNAASPGAAPMGSVLVIVFGVIGICIAASQVILMVIRGGMLVVLAGLFPTAAAFTNTETGRTWFRRFLAWLIAFILYKPAAAIIYATAFRLAGSDVFQDDGTGLLDLLTGLTLMALAVLALPALLRFVAPAVAAVSGTGGGGGGAALAATAMALPTGAMNLSSSRSGTSHAAAPAPPVSGSSSSSPAGSGNPGGGRGSAGAEAAGGAASVPASTPGAAAAGGSAGGAAGGAGSAGGAAAGAAGAGSAGAAAGPVGMAAGTALGLATGAARAVGDAARGATGSATDDGPSGSR
jgi:type IV secretion system protein TrbL